MPGNSNKVTYNGETPKKLKHHFSHNPPTSHPADKGSLRNYRLDGYKNGPESVPLTGTHTSNSGDTQAVRKAAVAAELNAILCRLG
ncbi:hypothetical protein F5Y13DRAFT_157790 [Hypoxylon sp. FL1857]|nr:hypothetical protein F5Y13DRAFT_157790 [Hypoxylon sp. FL1857]